MERSVGGPSADTDSLPLLKMTAIAFGVVTVLALTISAQVYLSMMSHGHSFVRMFAWQTSSWGFWALAAPLMIRTGARLSGDAPRYLWHLLRAFALCILLPVVHIVVAAQLTVWFQPFYPIQRSSFVQAAVGQIPAVATIDLLILASLIVGGNAYRAHQRARRLELRESRLEVELARARLDALQLEIQPHFLFNTLNSTAALIRLKDNSGALKMLLDLSELLRTTVDRPAGHLVALSAEIDFVKRYVDLQRTRFADRLEVDYDIADDCRNVVVPTFLLQPLVENAILHGAARQAGKCRVQIGARTEAGRLRLWVSDNGAGLPLGFDLTRHAGTGLGNSHSRLRQIYGRTASLDVRAGEGAGTIVEMVFPCTPQVQPARKMA